jgi:hypothetical protein
MVEVKEEQINVDLKTHQSNVEDWKKRALVEDLHIWVERFMSEFKLSTTVPALMLDQLSRTCYGHFRMGRNGFGLLNEIAINEVYITEERYWRVLATLLHELLHAEQANIGNPGKRNYHNKEFRDRAETFGLIVDQWGHTRISPPSTPFWDLLQKYGLTVPEIAEPTEVSVKRPGNSKLKLWICSCNPGPVRVRVAIPNFHARCLRCGHVFRRAH